MHGAAVAVRGLHDVSMVAARPLGAVSINMIAPAPAATEPLLPLVTMLPHAAGMSSSTAPPPWFTRMAVLGVPPRYAQENEGQAGAQKAREQLMVFYRGSEDEEEEEQGPNAAAGGAGAEAAGAANGMQEAAAGDRSNGAVNGAASGVCSSSSSSDDDGFVPFADKAPAADQEQEQPQQAQPPPQPQDEAGGGPQQQQQQQQQEPANEAAGAASGAGGSSKQPKWVFPGLNAELPPDLPPSSRDAYSAALQLAASLKTQLE